MADQQLDRPKLTRAILEDHGIYYHEKVYQGGLATSKISMPGNVNSLREALVDFSAIQIPDNWKSLFEKEAKTLRETHQSRGTFASDLDLKPPPSAYFEASDLRLSRFDWAEEIERLENNIYVSKKIALEARKLDYDAESGWMDFLKGNFFKRYQGQNSGNDNEYLQFDDFCLEENVLWDESKRAFSWDENFTQGIRERTGPKPDLSYGFRASQANKNLPGFEAMHHFRNLSFEVLGELRGRSPAIRSTVTTGLSRWQWGREKKDGTGGDHFPGRLLTPDFLCFPWAVVEAKHAQSKMSAEEYCQCQLANATACAYDLQEKLVKAVDHSGSVDPIIGFTCIGPRVRLWLTYRGEDSKIRMVCIWATPVDGTWGALALNEVTQNMQIWASRILRGRLVQYIDWAHRGVVLKTPSTKGKTKIGSGSMANQSDRTPDRSTSKDAAKTTGSDESKRTQAKAPGSATGKRKIRVRLPPAPDSKKAAEDARSLEVLTNDIPALNALFGTGTGPNKTPTANGRTTLLSGFGNGTASTPVSNPLSTTSNSPVITPSTSAASTPAPSIFGSPLPNTRNTPGGFGSTMFRYETGAVVGNTSPGARKIITIRKRTVSKASPDATNPVNQASSSSWKPPPPLFNFNRPMSPLPHTETPESSKSPKVTTATPIAAPKIVAPSPSPGVSAFQVFNPPQSNLGPPPQLLRSSRSESNLTNKVESSASIPQYTIFDRLAGGQSSSIYSSTREYPPGQLALPQIVSYPVLPTHARSVSSDRGKKDNSAGFRPRAASESGVRADTVKPKKQASAHGVVGVVGVVGDINVEKSSEDKGKAGLQGGQDEHTSCRNEDNMEDDENERKEDGVGSKGDDMDSDFDNDESEGDADDEDASEIDQDTSDDDEDVRTK